MSPRSSRWLVCLAALLALPCTAAAAQGVQTAPGPGSAGAGKVPATNFPPEITVDFPDRSTLFEGETVRIRVSAEDPDGDLVTLRLLNPPGGAVFDPVVNGSSPVESEVTWLVLDGNAGFRRLVFQASDDVDPAVKIVTALELFVAGNSTHAGLRFGDVSGDGIADLVGGASLADVGGVADAGAIYVWKGAATPAASPDAVLTVPGAVATDRITLASGQGHRLADVTGDGIADVVASASAADVGGVVDTGAVYVWAGGAGLVGSVAPTAVLSVPGAVALDAMGSGDGQGVQLADVTGDGVLDVVASAEQADVGGVADAGAVYVFAGGPGLTGSVAPTATLSIPGAVAFDLLGGASGQGVLLGEVTGDGVPDVVAGAQFADVGGVTDAGAIFVWAGGGGLTGAPAPTATLSVPGAVADDRLGVASGQALQLADLTDDGTPDVVCGTYFADVSGLVDTGAVYLFEGGAGLLGSVAPKASFADARPGALAGFVLTGQGVQVADVTGDGALDLVVGADSASFGGVSETGLLFVYEGGAGVAGLRNPTATLFVPGAAAFDNLGRAFGQGIRIAEVTGDSELDVIAAAQWADANAVADSGAVYVWDGGAGLTGPLDPCAVLSVPGAAAGDMLGRAPQNGMQVEDVSGDGVLDLVVGASRANPGGVNDAGAAYFWIGGAGLTGALSPDATMTIPGATAGDQLGDSSGQGIVLADVTGDGNPDVVCAARYADVGGVADAGAVFVWAGGGVLLGTPAPTATLRVAGATAFDRLGDASQTGVQVAEVSGDGVLDLIVGAQNADVGGTADVGAVYTWTGGGALAGTLSPTATLTVPGATAADRLGFSAGQSRHWIDFTGDGITDLVGAAQLADVGGVSDTGAAYLWTGPITGSAGPSVSLSVPGAVSGDQLGR